MSPQVSTGPGGRVPALVPRGNFGEMGEFVQRCKRATQEIGDPTSSLSVKEIKVVVKTFPQSLFQCRLHWSAPTNV